MEFQKILTSTSLSISPYLILQILPTLFCPMVQDATFTREIPSIARFPWILKIISFSFTIGVTASILTLFYRSAFVLPPSPVSRLQNNAIPTFSIRSLTTTASIILMNYKLHTCNTFELIRHWLTSLQSTKSDLQSIIGKLSYIYA